MLVKNHGKNSDNVEDNDSDEIFNGIAPIIKSFHLLRTRRKLESLTSCFRRKHGNQTASPFNDSTDATVADPNVATSPGTVTGPAPQEITPSNTAQTSNNKATESHSAEKDTLVKASAVQNRWLQLLVSPKKDFVDCIIR